MPQPSEERNLFDVLRLSLACAVVYSHAAMIGGYGQEGFMAWTRGQVGAGSAAVLGFFAISGFLVTRSYSLRQNAGDFLRSRLLRILPGYYLALLLTAFVLAPLIGRLNPFGEWHPSGALRFLWCNAYVRVGEWHVGSVLAGLPFNGSINGALWSLWPECLCYVLVMILGLSGLLRGRGLGLYAFTGLLTMMHLSLVIAPDRGQLLAPTLLRLTNWTPYFLAFFAGACVYTAREHLALGWRGAVFWGLVTVTLLRLGGWSLGGPLVLPLFLLHLAYSGRLRLSVDLSYGVYVLHFPVLQVLAATPLRQRAFGWFLTAGLGLTALLATASWLGVERPCLRLKRHL